MQDYAHPNVLVETDWLAERLGSNLRLVEVDVDTSAYDSGHISGAVGFNWQTQLQDQVRRDIVGRNEFEELLGRAGIGNGDDVILYGDTNNWFAAYAFWLFRLYGHENVRLLNGGRVKWIAEGRDVTTDVETFEARVYKAAEPDLSLRAGLAQVVKIAASGSHNLIDVRSPDEFSGKVLAPPGLSETAQRGGHIPGACNVPWVSAVDEDGTFKSVDELREIYLGSGCVEGKEGTVAYCRIGERSSHTWFVLKYLLGLENVSNYDGSWTEYGSVIGVPIER